MFITKTTTRETGGQKYYTHRLVRNYRDINGKVKRETLLNLGRHFSIKEEYWRILCEMVECELSGNSKLFDFEDVPLNVKKEASNLVSQISLRNSIQIKVQETFQAEEDYYEVNINSLEEDDIRYIGNENLAYQAACQLSLPETLLELGFNQKQANIALSSIISRLIVPGSELKAHQYITEDSGLAEIIDNNLNKLELQQLYFASDRLLKVKDKLEEHLYTRECELFNLTEVITLYDITNTYFEGHPEHKLAALGRSKEKRSDCELVSLGLLLDSSGFPKKSKILPGNISEPSTLQAMLNDLTSSSAIVIMDAGIATINNINYLKENNYRYIVVRRDSNLIMPEDVSQVLVKEEEHNTVSVALINNEEDKTVDLYCHSSAKALKSREFNNKMINRFEEELEKLNNNLAGCYLSTSLEDLNSNDGTMIILTDNTVYINTTNPQIPVSLILKLNTLAPELNSEFKLNQELTTLLNSEKSVSLQIQKYTGQVRQHSKIQNVLRNLFKDHLQSTKPSAIREYDKVLLKLGRLKEKYKSIAFLYDIKVQAKINNKYASKITWDKDLSKLENKSVGIYCLTSNVTDLSPEELWNTYTTLTEIESAFRSLKSELGMRPIYHQLEHRIDGHIFISILAYHVLHTIRYQLKSQGINYSWDSIRKIMQKQVRSTTTMKLKSGELLKIRKDTKPTETQNIIYKALGISSSPCAVIKTKLDVKI